VVNITQRPFTAGEKTPEPTEQEAGWALTDGLAEYIIPATILAAKLTKVRPRPQP